jgi:hypothetical protein
VRERQTDREREREREREKEREGMSLMNGEPSRSKRKLKVTK